MRKKDDIKLKIISNIDGRIIDEATDTRIALSKKVRAAVVKPHKARKRIIAVGSIAASILLITTVFLTLLLPMMNLGEQVPVYQGMTVSRMPSTSARAATAQEDCMYFGAKSSEVTLQNTENKQSGDAENETIRDHVDLGITNDDEIKYYVDQGETFIIEIHISNPKDYEIQSFTLNGKKYANYMFKEGSTMEKLLLEVTAPVSSGYVEYTIDAIKYIDGTEIKDVDMSGGNKSVKVGVAYPTAPTATVTSQQLSATTLSLSVYVTDPYALTGGNVLSVYLFDGEEIVDQKPLHIGENTVIFSDLLVSKTYEYGILTAYDLVDGKNLRQEWLFTDNITTLGAYTVNDVVPTKNSVSFAVDRGEDVGSITAISLYDAATNELVQTVGADVRAFENLLSNHTYHLYVDFTYTVNGAEKTDRVAKMNITTLAKREPIITFRDMNWTDAQIGGTVNMEDVDSVGSITDVGLYQNGQRVATGNWQALGFSGLQSYTDYEIAVSYTYNLNDGAGEQTDTAVYRFKTAPYLVLDGFSVINTEVIDQGDTIVLQVHVTNPDQAVFRTLVINGVEYAVNTSSSTFTKLFCSIWNDGRFAGGDTTLTIERMTAELDGVSYTVEPQSNNTANVFIFGALEVEGVSVVVYQNGAYVKKDYLSPSDEVVYLCVELDNPTGYQIASVSLDYLKYTDLIKLDDAHYLVQVPVKTGVNRYLLTAVQYQKGDLSTTKETMIEYGTFKLKSETVHYVSKPEDLLNMDSGAYYYELTNDIDLSGRTWVGNAFYGVLNGNGYSILNMSCVSSTAVGVNGWYGLFTEASGMVENLHFKDVLFFARTGLYDDSFGCIAARTYGSMIIKNCSIDENSTININVMSVGGFLGHADNAIISNCVNYGKIEGNSLSTVGSIVADARNTVITNCVNHGTVIGGGDGSAGGIVGDVSDGSVVSDCVNNGTVNGGIRNGGIAAYANDDVAILNCVNNGTVNGGISNGGIAAYANDDVAILNCVNNGTVNGGLDHGGIAAYVSGDVAISNCYALGENATADRLSSKDFYINELHFDETVWSLDDLDVANGKYPTLK